MPDDVLDLLKAATDALDRWAAAAVARERAEAALKAAADSEKDAYAGCDLAMRAFAHAAGVKHHDVITAGGVTYLVCRPPTPTDAAFRPADSVWVAPVKLRSLDAKATPAAGGQPLVPLAVPLPGILHVQDGEIRIRGHRIALYHVLAAHAAGVGEEEMAAGYYPTLTPDEVRQVFAFYRANRAAVDEYVARYRAELDRQRAG